MLFVFSCSPLPPSSPKRDQNGLHENGGAGIDILVLPTPSTHVAPDHLTTMWQSGGWNLSRAEDTVPRRAGREESSVAALSLPLT